MVFFRSMERRCSFRISIPLLLLSLWLLLCVTARATGEKDQLVVGPTTSLQGENEVECKKSRMHCKEDNDEVKESMFETGDYIYTNSIP